MCCGIARVTEPVGIVVEDEIVAWRLVVDGSLWVAIITVDISVGATLKGFLTNDRRCAAKNIGWSCREDRCLDVIIDHGVTPVVCGDINVEHSLSVKTTRVEVINSFNSRIIEIERLDITNNLVVHVLLIPCMVAERCRNSVDGVVEEVRSNGSRFFFTWAQVG